MQRQWTINGRFVTQPVTGVQRYGREIVAALDRQMGNENPLASGLRLELVVPEDAECDLTLSKIPVRRAGRSNGHKWEQIELPLQISGGLISLCNVGPVMTRRHIVCIHDANTRIVPESYSWKFRIAYRGVLPVLGRQALRVATVSHYSARQIARYSIAARDKIVVIPDGHEHALLWQPKHSHVTRAAGGPNTIVTIGSRAPHKNTAMLLRMAKNLDGAGLRLAVVGVDNERVFAAGNAVPETNNVTWLGHLSDSELAALLKDCLCLAVPSLTEGFGLPAVEAMAIGCPVVVANCGSLPEICGSAALYAAPDDVAGWLQNFLRLRDQPTLRERLQRQGVLAAARYSWSASAIKYLSLLAELDGLTVANSGSSSGRAVPVTGDFSR